MFKKISYSQFLEREESRKVYGSNKRARGGVEVRECVEDSFEKHFEVRQKGVRIEGSSVLVEEGFVFCLS